MNDVSRKLGSKQLEYEDEDPEIRALHDAVLRAFSLEVKMPKKMKA